MSEQYTEMNEERSGGRKRRRFTLRARITLTYSSLVAVSGAVLIALVYVLMRLTTVNYDVTVEESGSANSTSVAGLLEIRGELLLEFSNHMLIIATLVLIFMTAVSASLSWMIAGQVLHPLSEVAQAARRISQGDLETKLPSLGPSDEISDMTTAFGQMQESLRSSIEAHARFAANASHELRTPIATMQTMIDVTLAEPRVRAGELRELAEQLRTVNASNAELIDALLDLSRAQSGHLNVETVELTELTYQAWEPIQKEAEQRRIRCSFNCEETPMRADMVLIRQAISNLLRNGVKYNSDGGELRVSVGHGRTGWVHIDVSNDGEHIDAQLVDHLFEPFVRARGRTEMSQGHGLGLSLVEAVVKMHGGRIAAHARSVGGLNIHIELPQGFPKEG